MPERPSSEGASVENVTPEALKAEWDSGVDKLKAARVLPEDVDVEAARASIEEMEQQIQAYSDAHPDDLVPQHFYDSLAVARSSLLKARMQARDIRVVVAEDSLAHTQINAQEAIKERGDEWREQAKQEMMADTGRDPDNPPNEPEVAE